MAKTTYPRLCGGTFATLLICARKQPDMYRKHIRDGKSTHRKQDLIAGLININKPSAYNNPKLGTSKDKSFKSSASKYIVCKLNGSIYLPFTEGRVADEFDNCLKNVDGYESALNNTQTFIDDFIADGDERIELAERLLDLINSDESIDAGDEFYMGLNRATKKSEICNPITTERSICLSAFLLGVWHFVVTKRKCNTIGRDTIVSWHKNSDDDGKLGEVSPRKSGIDWNIKLTDTPTYISGGIDNMLANEKHDAPINAAPRVSLCQEFDSAISEFEFIEFIESEPFEAFTINTAVEKDELDSKYIDYKMMSHALPAFDVDYRDDYYSSRDFRDDIFPYSGKLLCPSLLPKSEHLVIHIRKETLPQIVSHPAYYRATEFVDKLSHYNNLLNRYLADVDALPSESINDMRERLMPAHSEIRECRAEVYWLYNELRDKLLRSPKF
ncbi:MAG: hypothetical protein FWC16_01870 [Defluviitaleaceae bacterium]|nr:hypothetical protein [Defluviitaleaceae bacterium]MCL2273646.1 hypothetical protein [Defluviitaleaceae bacterium]